MDMVILVVSNKKVGKAKFDKYGCKFVYPILIND